MTHTIVSLKLDFKTAREGGMAVSAVWRLVYLLATHSHWNQGACQSTQAGRAVPLFQNPKASCFWYQIGVVLFRKSYRKITKTEYFNTTY